MRLSSRKSGASVDMQMTSMIDIVFLLLIFFMVTSSFSLAERELDSAIKVRRAALSSAASDLQPAIVEVLRGSGGSRRPSSPCGPSGSRSRGAPSSAGSTPPAA